MKAPIKTLSIVALLVLPVVILVITDMPREIVGEYSGFIWGVSVCWIFMDSKRRESEDSKKFHTQFWKFSSKKWMVLTFLFWVIFFPAYFYLSEKNK